MGSSHSNSGGAVTTTVAPIATTPYPPTSPVNPLPESRYPEYHGPANISARLYDSSEVPKNLLLCLNTTFFLIGNVSAINIPFPAISKSRDPFNAYNNLTQCADASTCGGFNIMIIEKDNKTRCLKAISRDKFENSHGNKNSHAGLSHPDAEMLATQMWIGPVNITKDQWNTVYPPGDSCHNGPMPHKNPVYNDPKIDGFCIRDRNMHNNK